MSGTGAATGLPTTRMPAEYVCETRPMLLLHSLEWSSLRLATCCQQRSCVGWQTQWGNLLSELQCVGRTQGSNAGPHTDSSGPAA